MKKSRHSILYVTVLGALFALLGCSPSPAVQVISDAGTDASTPSAIAPPVVQPIVFHDYLAEFAASHPQPPPDPRTPAQLAQAACTGADGTWHCKSQKPIVMAATGAPPTKPVSWTVPQWYVDPQNSSATASDTNNCTTTSTPCLTVAQIFSRWGTNAPVLTVNVTITWLSGDSVATDPGVFGPTNAGGDLILIGALPAATFTGTLNVVTQAITNPDAGVGNELQSTFTTATGAVAANMLLVNTTHASRAFAQRNLGSGNWQITQPFTAYVPPFGFPSAVNTWLSGDSISGYVPLSVVIPYIYGGGLTILSDITTTALLQMFAPTDLFIFESVLSAGLPIFSGGETSLYNCITTSSPGLYVSGTNMAITGGATSNVSVITAASFGSNTILSGTNTVSNFFLQHTAYLDTGAILTVSGNSANVTVGNLFGPGTLNVASGTFQWGFPGGGGPINSPIHAQRQKHGLFARDRRG